MRLLPVAGVLLLMMAAILPFRASASAPAPGGSPVALALSQPVAGVMAWPASIRRIHEPGALLVVGGGLMGLGSWLRRVTAPADETPPV